MTLCLHIRFSLFWKLHLDNEALTLFCILSKVSEAPLRCRIVAKLIKCHVPSSAILHYQGGDPGPV